MLFSLLHWLKWLFLNRPFCCCCCCYWWNLRTNIWMVVKRAAYFSLQASVVLVYSVVFYCRCVDPKKESCCVSKLSYFLHSRRVVHSTRSAVRHRWHIFKPYLMYLLPHTVCLRAKCYFKVGEEVDCMNYRTCHLNRPPSSLTVKEGWGGYWHRT